MKQIYNPYLPLNEYIPDGEPHVFGDRLYIFGSHDKENGEKFCELDYVCYSTPTEDLTDWRFEGVIYQKTQDPENPDGTLSLYAPDVCQGPDGRFYLFYCLEFLDSISVAVCDTPAGKYEYYGRIHYPDGRNLSENLPYDPSVIYTDGHIYLYYGFAPTTLNIPRYLELDKPGGSVVELEPDMLTVKEGPNIILPSTLYGKGTSFEGHEYFEAPSIRKICGRFYLVYSSIHAHELCYAVSDHPMSGFEFGGVLVSNGDIGYQERASEDRLMAIGNNHGGLVKVRDQWYIFYHRHTHNNAYNRQGCAEPVEIGKNGHIPQVTITTSGMNGQPLAGRGTYPASICCNLTNGKMPMMPSKGRGNKADDFPIIASKNGIQYLSGITTGTLIGYKYFRLKETQKLTLICRGTASGRILIKTGLEKSPETSVEIHPSKEWDSFSVTHMFQEQALELYFVFDGTGMLEIKEFILDEV